VVASGLSSPCGLTFGPDGSLYIANQGTNEILRDNGAGLSSFVTAESGGLSTPRNAVFGSDGNLYVSSDSTGQVLRYDGQSGDFLGVFATSPLTPGPFWMEFGTDGYLYASARTTTSGLNMSILRFNATTGAFVDAFALGRDGWSFNLGPGNVIYSSSNSAGGFVDRIGPSSIAAFAVSLAGPSAVTTTVSYATADGSALAGRDYTATSGTLTFAPGETSKEILVPTLDDGVAEPTRAFTVSLSGPVNATLGRSSAVGTILEDTTKLAFAVQPSNTAAGATIFPQVVVYVEDSLGNLVTTDHSSVTLALGGNVGNGNLSGTLTEAAISGIATFSTLSINKSGLGYTLTAADGSLASATSSSFNITPGTATQLVISVQPSNTTAGASISPAVTVLVEDSQGNAVTTDTSTVTLAIGVNAGGGTLGGTVTVNAISGIASFTNLSINKVGNGYTLTCSDAGLAGATSNTFNITPGQASKFSLVAVPAITGTLFNFTVAAEDLYNNVATAYTGTVSLTSSDAAATFTPNPYTFTGGDAGLHTFSATLNTPGSQTITAKDTSNSAINGTSNAIATRALEVSSVTVTPSGLTVSFNKPFNPSVLNLYDGGSNLLGPADLTLVGASSGAIEGSIVVTSPTTLTFLYTFGVLPDDSYTLTLRSDTNGFVDNAGVKLDGNNSGVPGTNYTTSFSTSYNASDVGLVVASFARGPAQTVSLVVPLSSPSVYYPGLPIQLSDGDNATTAGFTLTYNTALLNVTGAMVDTSGNPQGTAGNYATARAHSTFTRTSHTVVSGIATDVFSFSTNGNGNLGTGHGPVTIGELGATIPNSSGQEIYKGKEVLALSGVSVAGARPGVAANGIQVVSYPADASGDGAYAGNDGSLVGQVAAGQDTGFAAYPLVDPVIIADVAGEEVVTANDASQVAQLAVHRSVPNIQPIPAGAEVAPSTAPDPTLNLPAELSVSADGTVSVPVNLDEARPAGSTGLTEATLALRFDPLAFAVSASDIHLGSIPQAGSGWTLTSTVDALTGQIGVTLYSLTPIRANLAGSLAIIDFHAQPGATVGINSIQLAASVNPNGQGWYLTNVADTNGAMILGMVPGSPAGLSLERTMVVLSAPPPEEVRPAAAIIAAAVEPNAVGNTLPVGQVSEERVVASDSAAQSASSMAPADGAKAQPASVSGKVLSLALSQAAGAVFQVGTSTVPLASAVPALLLPYQVFLEEARVAALPANPAIGSQALPGTLSLVVDGPMTSVEADAMSWTETDLYSAVAIAHVRPRRREATGESGPTCQCATGDTATLDQHFACLASNCEADPRADE
jgi:hypothetical protein